MSDPRVPWYIKGLIILVVAYIISPVDLIPDFIPLLGFLDELIIVSLLLYVATRLVPEEVFNEYRTDQQYKIKDKKLIFFGVVIVTGIWVFLASIVYWWWIK